MYLVLLSLPRGAMGSSVICDGGLSWSIFFLRRLSYLGKVGFLFSYGCQYWDEIGFFGLFVKDLIWGLRGLRRTKAQTHMRTRAV